MSSAPPTTPAHLTYISIKDFIKTHEERGLLKRVAAPSGQREIRGILLCPHAHRALYDRNSPIRILGASPLTQVALERWVVGAPMLVRFGGKRSDGFLARLDPPPEEVWEFRVTQPRPHVRALGRFISQDLILVTHIYTRNHLGRAGSSAWTAALNDCVTEWDNLFPDNAPLRGTQISDYISSSYKAIR